jgi:hypothetical protein
VLCADDLPADLEHLQARTNSYNTITKAHCHLSHNQTRLFIRPVPRDTFNCSLLLTTHPRASLEAPPKHLKSTQWSQRSSSGAALVCYGSCPKDSKGQVANTTKASPSGYGSSASKCDHSSTEHLSGHIPSTQQLVAVSDSGCRESIRDR